MSISEKLEIKPIEWFLLGGHPVCLEKPVRELEQQNADMLEALIESCRQLEMYYEMVPGYTSSEMPFTDIIEKADPQHRSWQEIKQLIGE